MATNPYLGDDEYELTTCDDCKRRVLVRIGRSGTEVLREINGQRHVCSNFGQPLLRAGTAHLPPLGRRPLSPLRK